MVYNLNQSYEKVVYMSLHPLLVFSVIVLSAMILLNKHIKWWIKAGAIIYYVVLSFSFKNGLEKVVEQYMGVLSIKEFWDKNSAFVDGYMPFFAFPVLALLIYSHYSFFVNSDDRNDKLFFGLSFLITGSCWIVFTFLISMYGYRP